MSIRILVTVSRSWTSWSVMRSALETTYAKHPGAVLVHGANPKGDNTAAMMWRALGGREESWPADWDHCGADCRHKPKARSNGGTYCPYAGYRRNTAMVESGPALCLAFIANASKGATHCAQAAEDAGIPVVRYLQGSPDPVLANVTEGEAA
jgi:hypothetical protein